MSPVSPKGFLSEDALEVVRPQLEMCAPVGAIGALFSKGLRCQCGRCSVNKSIRKGVVARYGKSKAKFERIPSIRFGPGLLVELAGLVKVGIPILGVSLVFAAPLYVMNSDTRRSAHAVNVIVPKNYVVRGVSTVQAKLLQTSDDRKRVLPERKSNSQTNIIVKVPEVINRRTLSPPTNLRAIASP